MPSWTGPAYPFSLFSIPLLLPPALCISDILIYLLSSPGLFSFFYFQCFVHAVLSSWRDELSTSSGKPSMTSNTWIKYSFLSVFFLCTLENSQSHYCTALEFVVSFSVTVSSARAVTMSLYFSLYPQHLMALYHHHYYHSCHLLST